MKVGLMTLVGLLSLGKGAIVFAQQPTQTDSQTGDRRAPLTNQSVLKMLDSGFSPEFVADLISRSECQFDTSPETVIRLKKAGVKESVLRATIQTQGQREAALPPSSATQSAPRACTDCAVVVSYGLEGRAIVGKLSSSIALNEATALLDTGREFVVLQFKPNGLAERPSALGAIVRASSKPPKLVPGESVRLSLTRTHMARRLFRQAAQSDFRLPRGQDACTKPRMKETPLSRPLLEGVAIHV
jgi:hypothetical protein